MDKKALEELLAVAISAAKAAGELVVAKQQAPLELMSKGFRDVVTDADFASQKLISSMILETFADHVIVGEEDDGEQQSNNDPSAVTWYLDPIDGTSNFSRGLPLFTISIAAAQHGVMQVGVVYDPLRGELFSAMLGHGSWLNGKALSVSKTDDLGDAIISNDWSRSAESRLQILRILTQLSQQARSLRAIGSAALAISWVAAGRLDAYFNLSLGAWDIAAAALILSEAGGKTGGLHDEPFAIDNAKSWGISTNGQLHTEFSTILRLEA